MSIYFPREADTTTGEAVMTLMTMTMLTMNRLSRVSVKTPTCGRKNFTIH